MKEMSIKQYRKGEKEGVEREREREREKEGEVVEERKRGERMKREKMR